MKKIVTLLVVCFLGMSVSFAQDRTADVKKLFNLMNSEKMIDQMMNSMMVSSKAQMAASAKTAEEKAKFEKFSDALNAEVKVFTKKLMDEVMVGLYAKHFTEGEIKDMISFYETPTGQKLLEKTPVITGEMMNRMMSDYLPEFQEKVKKKMEEL